MQDVGDLTQLTTCVTKKNLCRVDLFLKNVLLWSYIEFVRERMDYVRLGEEKLFFHLRKGNIKVGGFVYHTLDLICKSRRNAAAGTQGANLYDYFRKHNRNLAEHVVAIAFVDSVKSVSDALKRIVKINVLDYNGVSEIVRRKHRRGKPSSGVYPYF